MPTPRVLFARLDGWPRRAAAVTCLLLALASAWLPRPTTRAAASAAKPVVVAARDLAAGVVLAEADLRIASWPAAARPPNAYSSTAALGGRHVAGPIGRGEPITPTRLLGTALTTGLPPGDVAVPVHLADRSIAATVHAGDRVDLLVAPPDGAPALNGAPPNGAGAVARHARVLAVLGQSPDADSDVLPVAVVGVDAEAGARIARLATATVFAPVIIPP